MPTRNVTNENVLPPACGTNGSVSRQVGAACGRTGAVTTTMSVPRKPQTSGRTERARGAGGASGGSASLPNGGVGGRRGDLAHGKGPLGPRVARTTQRSSAPRRHARDPGPLSWGRVPRCVAADPARAIGHTGREPRNLARWRPQAPQGLTSTPKDRNRSMTAGGIHRAHRPVVVVHAHRADAVGELRALVERGEDRRVWRSCARSARRGRVRARSSWSRTCAPCRR